MIATKPAKTTATTTKPVPDSLPFVGALGPSSAFARVRDAMRSVGVPEVDAKMAELGVDVLRAVVAKLSQPGAILPVLYHALHVRKKEHPSLPLDDCHAILKFLSDNMEAVRYDRRETLK